MNYSCLRISRALPGALLALLCFAPAPAGAETLRLLGWANYMAADVPARFATRSGIEIAYHPYDSLAELEILLAQKEAGDDFDILILPARLAGQMAQRGELVLLDTARIPRFAALDPLLMRWLPAAPEGKAYALPYLWGTSGLAWDKQKSGAVENWRALFDPAQAGLRAACGIGLAAEPVDLLAGVLLFHHEAALPPQSAGFAPGGEPVQARPPPLAPSAQELALAQVQLMAAAPYAKGLFSSWAAAGALIRGDLCLAQLRAGDLYRLLQSGTAAPERFGYLLPPAGALGWMDVVAVRPNADLEHAYQWLNFLLQAPVAAANAAAAGHGPVVVDAEEFLPAGAARNPLLSPAPPARAGLTVFRSSDADARALQTRLEHWFEAGRP